MRIATISLQAAVSVTIAATVVFAPPCDAHLFDIGQGTTILDNSPLYGAADAREIFGFVSANGPEPGNVIFPDFLPAGTVGFIEWEMPQQATVGRLRISGSSDGCTSELRTFDHVRFLAEVEGEMAAVVDEAVPVPYQYDTDCTVILSRTFPLVTASHFRIEFTQHLDTGYTGARIFEVEGFRYSKCGDANDDDKVSATDALHALGAAVGSKFCEKCICDVNDDGSILATDALRLLRSAVGLPDVLGCPTCVMAG